MADDAPGAAPPGPRIDELVLDAGPLVTQQPLAGLAKKIYIPPAVVAELRDKRARDHLEWLQQTARASTSTSISSGGSGDGGAPGADQGYEVEIREPGPEATVAVMNFAKKTGDYAVLSRPDLSVLALTYALEVQRHDKWRIRDEVGGKTGQQKHSTEQQQQKQQQPKGSKNDADATASVNAKVQPSEEQSLPATVLPPTFDSESSKTKPQVRSEAETSDAAKSLHRDASESTDEIDEAQSQLHSLSLGKTDRSDIDGADAVGPAHDILSTTSKETAGGEDLDSEDDEEEGGEWITPENIAKHKSRSLGLVTDADMALVTNKAQKKTSTRKQKEIEHGDDGWSTIVSKSQNTALPSNGAKPVTKRSSTKPPPRMTVACMTGDYAVQNVLLQMGMSLVGIDGQRIKQVKSWVLRCHACFKICKDSQRTFCPQCGNPTLMRTSVTSTAPEASGKGAGGMQVHLKKNFQYKNRGTKYSLPLPKAGKAGGQPQSVPILREDQIEWQRGLQRERVQRDKEERALQKALAKGSDSLSARYEDVDELSILMAGKAGRAQQGLPALGIGRRNPNEKYRRKV